VSDFLVTSHFTIGTGYEALARRLQDSLQRNNINHEIKGVKNRGDWNKNCKFKPVLIKTMMHFYPHKAIVYVDSDAIFHGWPSLFAEITEDFACHFRNWKYRTNELLSGTLFFANNPRARRLLNQWIRANLKFPSYFDQVCLQWALKQIPKDDISVHRLPIEYCTIFDDANRRQIFPVIEHFQASRHLKRKINRVDRFEAVSSRKKQF